MAEVERLKANYEIYSDKSKNAVTDTRFIKHKDQWLDEALGNIDPHWIGTKEEYEVQKDTIEAGTTVIITDDYSEAGTQHNDLIGRSAANAHPISAITGLQSALDGKADVAILNYITPKMFGAVGNGTHDDTEAFKNCISNALSTKNKIIVPLGTYKITDTLVVDGRVNIEGISREATVLDFSAMAADKTAIQYCKNSGSSFCTLKNMTIEGNKNITAIYISGGSQKNMVDSIFENVYIDNFKLGLKSAWCWCLSFRDIRFNNCTNGMLLESQTNNILFDRVSTVNITNLCVDMVNCEGLQFNSCEFANSKDGVRMWQSWAVMYNPYFEKITGTSLLPGYTTGGAQLSIIGGKVEGKLYIAQKNSTVDIRSATVTSGYYPLSVVTQYLENTPCVMAKHLYIEGTQNNLLYSFESGDETIEFATQPYVLTPHENYASFYSSAGGFKFENLEVGKQYTLVMNIRNINSTAITMTIAGKTGVALESNYKDNEFLEYCMPFIAAGTALSVTMKNTIDVRSVKLYEGIYTVK